ncbi:MAG: hypothetical protein MJ001_09015, partial [Paludibacteraceae bacterium]|nr:hypothetical protein [Paludibacteraceae bacterium]
MNKHLISPKTGICHALLSEVRTLFLVLILIILCVPKGSAQASDWVYQDGEYYIYWEDNFYVHAPLLGEDVDNKLYPIVMPKGKSSTAHFGGMSVWLGNPENAFYLTLTALSQSGDLGNVTCTCAKNKY